MLHSCERLPKASRTWHLLVMCFSSHFHCTGCYAAVVPWPKRAHWASSSGFVNKALLQNVRGQFLSCRHFALGCHTPARTQALSRGAQECEFWEVPHYGRLCTVASVIYGPPHSHINKKAPGQNGQFSLCQVLRILFALYGSGIVPSSSHLVC